MRGDAGYVSSPTVTFSKEGDEEVWRWSSLWLNWRGERFDRALARGVALEPRA